MILTNQPKCKSTNFVSQMSVKHIKIKELKENIKKAKNQQASKCRRDSTYRSHGKTRKYKSTCLQIPKVVSSSLTPRNHVVASLLGLRLFLFSKKSLMPSHCSSFFVKSFASQILFTIAFCSKNCRTFSKISVKCQSKIRKRQKIRKIRKA